MIGAKMPPDLRPDVHAQYDKNLNIRNGAALLMSWTDKVRSQAKGQPLPQREFDTIPEAQQELFKHLVYRILDAIQEPK